MPGSPREFFWPAAAERADKRNPNVRDFMKNTQALHIINNTCGNIRGNCRGSLEDENLQKRLEDECTPLSK